ncbi:Membrane-bound lytic murein transglycosylase B precursor [Roseibacterium elongatum DSM 19469]|uniref:Membrane-bound lytic murein transglycosylase B n=1 Tax=Roseicyclus elongatus DSM 19469 TaxID=1294273 RepID=W8S9U1_9RHOB|nr:lytic murein transglycosylase [Roseibacterium elongatum]AHM05786.1 Membrane-bound lytic murein transglycosylase B precursor [Roseibacterium elongatum DSM 19469]
MLVSRRNVLTTAGAAALAATGCTPALGPSGAVGAAGPSDDPAFRPQPNAAYDAWVAAFRPRALAQGISGDAFDRAFRGQGYLPGVIERDRNQTEFRRTTEDYLALVASDADVSLGRGRIRPHRATLGAIEDATGVAAAVIGAIWGVETAFGTRLGDIPVISATSTLAWEGRREGFFTAQLLDAIRIVQSGDTTPDRMLGSWAGAMGHTQVMPSVYQEYAVDFDGDGRRGIWSADPTDSLATAATYLQRHGWRRGQPWGMEVRLPEGFDTSSTGRRNRRATTDWQAMGVRQPTGGSLPDHGAAAIHAPGGANGPAWILWRNFDVILRYNPSTNYGIGVGYLSDRLAGGGPLSRSFGPDSTGLTQAERREVQRLLTRAGFDAGTPDGVIGRGTEAAIRAFQQARGLPVTGEASPDLLMALRRA